jgi:UDP-N-acetylmuramate dehydrogenase
VDLRTDLRLADLTTLRVGGPARAMVVVDTEEDLVAAVRDAGAQALVVGGGSNLVVGDQGFDGTVVVVRTRGIGVQVDDCAGVWLDLAAGEVWDDVVARAVAEGWVGVEALSGIPGLVGATPLQNVGAYGQQVSETIARVRTFDRLTGRRQSFAAADCGFGYRTSRFKAEPDRYVVLGVELALSRGTAGRPIAYAELARSLGVEVGERAPLPQVRDAVLELRRSKGMVLDPADHDTWSAGSFFTNPVLTDAAAAALPGAAPRFPQTGGAVKTSAAWLIENAGFARGYSLAAGTGVALSHKHSLAITNTGGATAAAVVALASHLRHGVRDRFGITLEPEPVLVGCTLD